MTLIFPYINWECHCAKWLFFRGVETTNQAWYPCSITLPFMVRYRWSVPFFFSQFVEVCHVWLFIYCSSIVHLLFIYCLYIFHLLFIYCSSISPLFFIYSSRTYHAWTHQHTTLFDKMTGEFHAENSTHAGFPCLTI